MILNRDYNAYIMTPLFFIVVGYSKEKIVKTKKSPQKQLLITQNSLQYSTETSKSSSPPLHESFYCFFFFTNQMPKLVLTTSSP